MADTSVREQIKNALKWFKLKLLTDTPVNNSQLALSAKGGLNLQDQVNEINSTLVNIDSDVLGADDYYYLGGTICFNKCNNIVCVSTSNGIMKKSPTPGTWTTIAYISKGFRPVSETITSFNCGQSNGGLIKFTTDGNIQLNLTSGVNLTGLYIWFNAAYISG